MISKIHKTFLKPFKNGDLIIWEDGEKWFVVDSVIKGCFNSFYFYDVKDKEFDEQVWTINTEKVFYKYRIVR